MHTTITDIAASTQTVVNIWEHTADICSTSFTMAMRTKYGNIYAQQYIQLPMLTSHSTVLHGHIAIMATGNTCQLQLWDVSTYMYTHCIHATTDAV